MPFSVQNTYVIEKIEKCPVCKNEGRHLYLKDSAYHVSKRDGDQYVVSFEWADPKLASLHPFYFNYWFCTNCYFTEERSHFLKNNSVNVGPLWQSLVDTYKKVAETDEVIRKLGSNINYPIGDFLSALNLHYLALYIQLLPAEYNRDLKKLARYYHRLAWMFRLDNQKSHKNDDEVNLQHFSEKFDAFQSNYMNTLSSLEDFNSWLEKEIETEKKLNHPGWAEYEDQFKNLYKNTSIHLDKIMENIQAYHSLKLEYQKKHGNVYNSHLNEPFGGYSHYHAFLQELSQKWPGLPTTEILALRQTIEYYKAIISSRLMESEKLKLFQIYWMVIQLNFRLEEYNEVLSFGRNLIMRAENFKNAAQRKLKSLEVIKDDRVDQAAIHKQIKKVSEMIKRVSHILKQAQEQKREQEIKLARELYTNHRDLSIEELSALFRQNGISSAIQKIFLEEKKKENKKGIFQIFKL
ncbi:MAG: hypothetical protein Kow0037_17860 [Calditrichia bacterium]